MRKENRLILLTCCIHMALLPYALQSSRELKESSLSLKLAFLLSLSSGMAPKCVCRMPFPSNLLLRAAFSLHRCFTCCKLTIDQDLAFVGPQRLAAWRELPESIWRTDGCWSNKRIAPLTYVISLPNIICHIILHNNKNLKWFISLIWYLFKILFSPLCSTWWDEQK
jgi:hypothetical protein